MVRIVIANTGPSIPLHKQSQLFEPFNRLGAERSTIEGTGIGLAIAKRLIEAMHGRSVFHPTETVRSSGSNSTMPHRFIRPTAIFETALQLEARTVSAKVIYIEDNLANRVLMTQILKDFLDIDVILAETMKDGLNLIQQQKPDLVLTDIHLPDGTGFDLLAAMRATISLAAIPVIAVTADAMETTRERIKQAGFDASYTKPFQVANVIQMIHKLLKAAG